MAEDPEPSVTTIAANLQGMAADSFVSDGSRISKIFRLSGPMLVGMCGSAYRGKKLVDWLSGGSRGPVPLDIDGAEEEVLILDRTGLYTMDAYGVRLAMNLAYAAIGSGKSEAHGAMFCGATPEQAVEASCFHDPGSKGPVIYEPLRRKSK